MFILVFTNLYSRVYEEKAQEALSPRLGEEWNEIERNKKNNFKIFSPSLIWEF